MHFHGCCSQVRLCIRTLKNPEIQDIKAPESFDFVQRNLLTHMKTALDLTSRLSRFSALVSIESQILSESLLPYRKTIEYSQFKLKNKCPPTFGCLYICFVLFVVRVC